MHEGVAEPDLSADVGPPEEDSTESEPEEPIDLSDREPVTQSEDSDDAPDGKPPMPPPMSPPAGRGRGRGGGRGRPTPTKKPVTKPGPAMPTSLVASIGGRRIIGKKSSLGPVKLDFDSLDDEEVELPSTTAAAKKSKKS